MDHGRFRFIYHSRVDSLVVQIDDLGEMRQNELGEVGLLRDRVAFHANRLELPERPQIQDLKPIAAELEPV